MICEWDFVTGTITEFEQHNSGLQKMSLADLCPLKIMVARSVSDCKINDLAPFSEKETILIFHFVSF